MISDALYDLLWVIDSLLTITIKATMIIFGNYYLIRKVNKWVKKK